MRYFKYVALLGVFVVLAATPSPAQVSFGIRIGPDYGYYHVPPACPYGYYPDYPFDCAAYGYWGPEWFVDGVFIGAGPWYRFYYAQPVLYRRWYGPGYAYFPREFHRFREHDWDGDRRFHRFEGDRDFHRFDRDRFDHDDRRFRGDGDRHFDRDRRFGGERWDHNRDQGFRGDRGFREHGRGGDHGERRGHGREGGHDGGGRHRG